MKTKSGQILIFLYSFLALPIAIIINQSVMSHSQTDKSIKGVQTNILPTSTFVSDTVLPVSSTKSGSIKSKIQVSQKQYGAWYWREELGRFQRWLGIDNMGKDIWTGLTQ